MQLTFVVNASTSLVCRTLTENDISARLPAYLQRALYKHLDHLIDVDKVPDMEPGNLASVIFKLEKEAAEQPRKETKTTDDQWKSRYATARRNSNHRPRLEPMRRPVPAAMPAPSKDNQDSGFVSREQKRFDDLDDGQKSAIIKVQTQLSNKPLGARLSQEEKNMCLAHGLCQRCRWRFACRRRSGAKRVGNI